jgi:hypothetical protein
VVEILMAMSVLAVGVVGIISTQKVTVASNLHAKNLAMATHIAQSWLGLLETEGMLWSSNGSLTRTDWLARVDDPTAWFRPVYDADRAFGPAFDVLGNPVPTLDQPDNAQFCVDLRLFRLTATSLGGGLIRAEVRVIWLRPESIVSGGAVAAADACAIAAVDVEQEDQARLFHFVFMSGAIRQVGR